MTVRPVHWHEGMFLRPHHLQAAQRFGSHFTNTGGKWDLHYNWGLRSVELDLDALANYRLVIRALRARLRDGTLVCVPEDGALPQIDLRPAFEGEGSLTVSLAVPILQLGRTNVGADGRAEGARYLLDTQELEDENTGLNPQPIQVRLLNLKLLLSTQDQAGYETIPVARLQRSARAEATPELDTTYIPPLLACDGWQPLYAGILQAVYDRIGKQIEQRANQVVTRGISLDSHAQGDPLILARLRAYNEAYAVLGVLAFAEGVHPLPAYVELCRIVGQLALFGGSARPPDLPRYDHDDLGTCFYRVKQYIDELIDLDRGPDYKERPFIGAGLRMQVTLEPSWLESAWQMYVGVHSALSADDCNTLLTKPGQLDMKIGSSDRVDPIFTKGLPGLEFAHAPRPPRALPSAPGLTYFQVRRESQQQEWQHVQRELTLAIRLREKLIAGNIEGQKVLTIRHGGQTTNLQFTLFVVKPDS